MYEPAVAGVKEFSETDRNSRSGIIMYITVHRRPQLRDSSRSCGIRTGVPRVDSDEHAPCDALCQSADARASCDPVCQSVSQVVAVVISSN